MRYLIPVPDPDERYRVSRFLLERQCDVSRVKNGFDGPFHYLFRQKKYDMTQTIELCRMLLENGADPNQAGERNYLPVSCLIMMNVPEKELISLLKFWLGQQGLNMTLRTFEGLTPLDIAKKYGKKRCEDEIKNILIAVDDIERSKQFYHDLFGLDTVLDNDGNMILTEGLVLQDKKIWEKFLQKDIIPESNACELYFEERDLEAFAQKLEKLYPSI